MPRHGPGLALPVTDGAHYAADIGPGPAGVGSPVALVWSLRSRALLLAGYGSHLSR